MRLSLPPTVEESAPVAAGRPTRAELRLTMVAKSATAGASSTCSGCGSTLGADERFCASCGQARDGDEIHITGLGAKAEAAWKEIQERLQLATAGRYEIVHELGRGGMAAVYLAREIALKREVAIKVMRPSFLLDPGMVERFLREARTMAALRHANIVTIYSVEEAQQLYFFVMQFVPGRSLDRVISGQQLPVAAMQAVIFEAAAALNHAHRQGVIHRDIKPANILLDKNGSAIVTDFGIAKVADVQATSATVGTMGTPLYMSPEQCEAKPVTPLSDMYSLGNVAYEMLTGVPPFQRPTAIALGTAILYDKPKPIRAFRDDCPPSVEEAVMRMLAKKPGDRFPNLNEAVAALGGEPLGEDDPIREFLKILAQSDDRPSGRHLTPRPSKTGSLWSRSGWTGFRGDQFRRAIAAVIAIGTISPLGYWGYRKYADSRRAASERVVTTVPSPGPTDSAVVPPPPAPSPQPAAPIDPPPPPASPGTETVARARQLAGRVRAAIRAANWKVARDSVAALLAIAPTSAEGRALKAQIEAAIRAGTTGTVAVVPPAAPVPAAPSPPPIAPPPPADSAPKTPVRTFDAAPVRHLIDRYVAAINGRDLARLKAAYPGLGGKQEADWRDRFSKEIKRLSATVTTRRIDEAAGGASATFVIDLVLEPNGAPPMSYRIRCDATAHQVGGEWTFATLTERGAESGG